MTYTHLTPVSYTHLDVYKRQPIEDGRLLPNSVKNFRKKDEYLLLS
ncbi:hypothetical protein A5874_001771 [Enterococcus faecium]|nr:hypothetical protein A5874_001771 [Enterococcus faecium]